MDRRSEQPPAGDRDVVLDRDDDGRVYASVPHSVRHYGDGHFDWGYVGPATAELALNILNWILPPRSDGESPIACDDGACSALAWRLHRSFMAEMLVRMPHGGGCIREASVRGWLQRHLEPGRQDLRPARA